MGYECTQGREGNPSTAANIATGAEKSSSWSGKQKLPWKLLKLAQEK